MLEVVVKIIPVILSLFVIVAVLSSCAPTAIAPTIAPPPTRPMPTLTLMPTPRATLAPTPTPAQAAIQTPAWFRNVTLYQIFVRSFYDSNGDGIGDLQGIIAKLDYLRDLGIGAIWLTPIFASPSYHGYDTIDYYKIQPEFGTEADLRELVKQAHARNIRVILDYVVAHTSNEHPFFKDAFGNPQSQYADWYRWRDAAHTSYESFASTTSMPTLNHDNPAVAKYLIDVAKYWMQTGIDGYRADYVLNVPHAFWKQWRAELKAINPDILLLAEAWTNGVGIKPYYADEFDAAFDFPLYGDIEGSNNSVGDSILLGVRAPSSLDGSIMLLPRLYPPGAQRVEFLNNHDTNRVMSEAQQSVPRAKLGATLLLTIPGTPMIYYGEEIGMRGVKGADDKPRREPMDWYASETGKGMTNWFKPADRNNKPNDGISVEEQVSQPGSLLEHYRALVALRNANSALRTGAWEKIATPDDTTYAYLRRDATGAFVVTLNFANQPATLALDLGATSLPDGAYQATDRLSQSKVHLAGLTLNIQLAGLTSAVWQLTQ